DGPHALVAGRPSGLSSDWRHGRGFVVNRRRERSGHQNAATRRTDALFSPGAFLFLCRGVAGSAFDNIVRARGRVGSGGFVFEFDHEVWETIQAKLGDADISR